MEERRTQGRRRNGRRRTRLSPRTQIMNNLNPTDLERQIQDHAARKAIQRYDSIQALEKATDTKFSVTHGESSKELINNISDAKYNEKGELTALKFKGEDTTLTAKGEIDKRYKQNKGILKAI